MKVIEIPCETKYFNIKITRFNNRKPAFPSRLWFLEKIRKLKFKFRHHDGTVVDFKNMPFTFTIEATQLIDEPRRRLDVNMPFVYST
mgnify:CR=1 FL=1